MKKQTKEIMKKAGAVIGVAAIAGLSAFGGAQLFPKTITEQVEVPVIVNNTITETITETIEVPVETIVYKNVTVEVEVMDEDMNKALCDRLLFDDMSECVEEVEAEDIALKLAFKALEDEQDVFDLLEDEGLIDDEDEAKIIKVYDKFEDLEVTESDFDDDEYEFKITLKVEDEDADEKKKFEFTVSVKDGESEIEDVIEL